MSVLSPTIFNLVVDPLLSTLRQRGLGLSVNGLFLEAFAHADDIRTSAANTEDTTEQVLTVEFFYQVQGPLPLPRKVCSTHYVSGQPLREF